jgi:hypothetical protein
MTTPSISDQEIASWLKVVESKVAALRFGSVQIIVHEGRVTQVESTEKFRFAARRTSEVDPSAGDPNNASDSEETAS